MTTKTAFLLLFLATIGGFGVLAYYEHQDIVGDPSQTRPETGAAYVAPRPPAIVSPSDETDFTDILDRWADAYRDAPNDIARVGQRAQRRAELCRLGLPFAVTNWLGTLEEVATNWGDKGVVKVRVSRSAAVRTWNNELSDVADHTLVQPGAPVYAALATLRVGTRVWFSGTLLPSAKDCFREISITESGDMTEPEMLFRFSSIELADSPRPQVPSRFATTAAADTTPAPDPVQHAPAVPGPPPETLGGTAFERGLADRGAWEVWLGRLQGDLQRGAIWWSGQRSLARPGSCLGRIGPSPSADFTAGCAAAQQRLDLADLRRRTEPDYRAGWNSWQAAR